MSFPEQWGYVNKEGQVWQKDCQYFKGRQIGRLDGKSPEEILAFYALRFEKLVQYQEELQAQFEQGHDRPGLVDKINRMLDFIVESDALGNFDDLIGRLMTMKGVLDAELNAHLEEQERLCARVEELLSPADWKAATEEVKKLQAQFKLTGPVPEQKSRLQWDRFRAVCDQFFENRRLFFAELDRQKEENYQRKLDLCRKAEELSLSSEWKETGEALKHLLDEWKSIGPVARDKTEYIWQRFKTASDTFFERRDSHYAEKERERLENLKKKQALCERSEILSEFDDWKAAGEELKQLQEEWKHVGPVPKQDTEQIWKRFKEAHDRFFERRHAYYKARDEERLAHLKEKERLCEEVESLYSLRDLVRVREEVKEIQKKWKIIGPVSPDQADGLWARFKLACDRIFQGEGTSSPGGDS
ncbi:MAG TPA: DUF349 domain-containing protein [Candidatus Omnitrophota bacterium]|nr:DUF349 domain-containing protein [Candidatus Omnitrophota bacterium]HPN56488.1 DUF349 domain-containing protein [Candidatus Omnitrophota bacterium]